MQRQACPERRLPRRRRAGTRAVRALACAPFLYFHSAIEARLACIIYARTALLRFRVSGVKRCGFASQRGSLFDEPGVNACPHEFFFFLFPS
ncbi:hypothetical protein MRX96_052201 [Rhipicephalus microplus]